ncbi:hypothetical protein ACSBLW_11630 [Thioclava sp. FR2]|uniref:hypothetical protein n=1 Tax=Thioclava sp. FR2 TaxID=3445780 RepID=UPI003EB9F15F
MKTFTHFRFVVLSLAVGSSVALAPFDAQAAYAPAIDAIATDVMPDMTEIARRGRGADDGTDTEDDRRGRGADDGPNHTFNTLMPEQYEMARRGRGADDGPGHVRGGGRKRGRGADDGPNHT